MSDSFWEAAYRQNIAKMIGVCCRYTQNRQTAEDLAHDAFLVAIDKVSSFENKGPFEAWLRRIVVNVALQHLREQKRQEKWEAAHAYQTIIHEIQDENPFHDDRVFSEAELLEVINSLPDHHRLVFNLYVVDNFTHAQIASLLHISEGTSKSHLSRARKRVRELLHDKLRNGKERKRAFFWLLLPYPFGGIDRLVAGKLSNLAILPQRNTAFHMLHEAHAPVFKPAGISYATYVKTGVLTIATAVFLAGGPEVRLRDDGRAILPVRYPMPVSTPDSPPPTATISENRIIVEKTKISEPMKNLSALGGLLVASLALDTAQLTTGLPDALKNRQITISGIPGLAAKPEIVRTVAQRNADPTSGTFYAAKLFWSAENSELYFLGNDVKVNVSSNKFAGAGKFSFLNKVSYLVVDGVAVKQNQTIKLQEKKYNLVSLDGAEGMRKYGENGKSGVVEISLAE
ncbi:RNA polymerase sigma factor [Dyadobacter sp. SG02]|uniref:RNA polymerase sigma factor n=1 Tax=Dyadobacter sp. SG02 TaxID=1855291 RepID=UPI0015A6B550|nr:RNA polymerase sigma factor [Dyadobacter sp. SG02]